jgi:hypothetical protein
MAADRLSKSLFILRGAQERAPQDDGLCKASDPKCAFP